MRRLVLILAIFLSFLANKAWSQPRQLTLHDAVQAALESNASLQIVREQEVQADARAQEQLAVLLPNVQGSAGYVNQTIKLGGRGIQFLGIPTRVGPFGVFDARLQYTEPVLDVSLIRRYQATRRSADATEFDTEA